MAALNTNDFGQVAKTPAETQRFNEPEIRELLQTLGHRNVPETASLPDLQQILHNACQEDRTYHWSSEMSS
jgi:hypothetical protein